MSILRSASCESAFTGFHIFPTANAGGQSSEAVAQAPPVISGSRALGGATDTFLGGKAPVF